jgi:hypothetical protein
VTLQPCLVCGEPSQGSRCPEHTARDQRTNHRRDTKKAAWIKLSERARKLQPFCSICGSRTNLQADHSPRAWARQLLRKPVRIWDITVLCGRCNSRAGSSKPGSKRYEEWAAADGDVLAKTPDETLRHLGATPLQVVPRPTGKAEFPSQTTEGSR